MNPSGDQSPPSGLPWDAANGFRIGALSGALLGGAVCLLVGYPSFWIIAAGTAMGGAVGYWAARRERRNRPRV